MYIFDTTKCSLGSGNHFIQDLGDNCGGENEIASESSVVVTLNFKPEDLKGPEFTASYYTAATITDHTVTFHKPFLINNIKCHSRRKAW